LEPIQQTMLLKTMVKVSNIRAWIQIKKGEIAVCGKCNEEVMSTLHFTECKKEIVANELLKFIEKKGDI